MNLKLKPLLTAMFLMPAISVSAHAQQTFQHTITGEDLKIMENALPEGRDTPAVKSFLQSGKNPYNEIKGCLPRGEENYLSACSGCHGHLAEGKVGPGLNDSYWTYPKNTTDKGLFETIFGGGQGMMGPHGSDMTLDDHLKLMAWIRHLNIGDAKDAEWLSDEQKAEFKPFNNEHWEKGGGKEAALKEECKISAK